MIMRSISIIAAALASSAALSPASAQSLPTAPVGETPTVNITLGGGVDVRPRFPGDGGSGTGFFPVIEVWSSDEPYPAEAPDEGLSIPIVGNNERSAAGFTMIVAPRRRARDVGRDVDSIGFGVEPGIYASTMVLPALRLRGELRHGIGAHAALTGDIRADLVVRTPQDGIVATIGPRVRWGSAEYVRDYFGVTPAETARTSLAPYRPGSGIYAYGAAASAQFRINDRWGIYSYGSYDRLVGDAAASPVVRTLGSRDQLSGGIGVTYTFRIRR
jgi:MipA family protein